MRPATSSLPTRMMTVGTLAPGATAAERPSRPDRRDALAFDRYGDLFVANAGSNTVTEFAPGSTTAETTYTSGISHPAALAFDSSGNLYVANEGSSTVSEFLARKHDRGANLFIRAEFT